MKRIKILQICFVAYGLVMSTALFFIFIPNGWIAWIGETYDLPAYEITPVFEYMARGMSSLCFVIGVFLVYIGLHLRDYLRLVGFLKWLAILTLPVVVFIHAKIDTPFWWKAGDVWGVLLLCILCFATPKENIT